MEKMQLAPRFTVEENLRMRSALNEGYRAFYRHGLDQLSALDESNGMLRFSAVTMQVALELFLKYYFVTMGKVERITDEKKRFVRFSKILEEYIASYHVKWRVAQLGELQGLVTARNRIVHSGAFGAWDSSLAKQIVTCALFIQQLSGEEQLGSAIPIDLELRRRLARNRIWKRGAVEIARELALRNSVYALLCPFCSNRSLLPQNVLACCDEPDELSWNCLACLETLMDTYQGEMIECPSCKKKTFWVDTLNRQPNGQYCGKCLNCETLDQVS